MACTTRTTGGGIVAGNSVCSLGAGLFKNVAIRAQKFSSAGFNAVEASR